MADSAGRLSLPEIQETEEQAFSLGQRGRQRVRLALSYLFLTIGALFMLFPMFWMITTALKPDWQTFTRPIIWIPQHWHKVDAGDTVRNLNIWLVPDQETGEPSEVVKLASRQYQAVLPVGELPEIMAVSEDELSTELANRMIGEARFSVRQWDGRDVISLASEDGNRFVVYADEIQNVLVLPRDIINSGERSEVLIGDYEYRTRIVELDGETVEILTNIAPNDGLATVTQTSVAASTFLVPFEQVSDPDLLPLDTTEIEQVLLLNDDDGEARYVMLEQQDWSPTMDVNILHEQAFTIAEDDFVQTGDETYNLGVFPVGTYTDDTGQTQEVAIILREHITSTDRRMILVMPTEYMENIVMVPFGSLQRPLPETVGQTVVRVKDFTLPTVNDETINMDLLPGQVGILGQRQSMALLVPADAFEAAYDTPNEDVTRKMSISFVWTNFIDAMSRTFAGATFLTFFKNSTIVTGLSIVGHLLSCTVVAYAFARMQAPGKNMLFAVVLATMMLPGFVTVVPVYKIFRDLGMINTLWPMFLRSFFGNAFLIFLMRQFFSTIPAELEDAATIDGANRVQTFVKVMLPLITPAIATVAIFTFLWTWNNLFDALLYLNSPENYTVAIGLKQFIGQYESEFNLMMAAATIVMLPTVLLFFFAQRFFIEGITLTGMKG